MITREDLALRLVDREPQVTIAITFRAVARLWPLLVEARPLDVAACSASRVLLIAETVARVRCENQVRAMAERIKREKQVEAHATGPGPWGSVKDLRSVSEVSLPAGAASRSVWSASQVAYNQMVRVSIRAVWTDDTAAPPIAEYSDYLPPNMKEAYDAALRADCECIESRGLDTLWRQPLWPGEQPPVAAFWGPARKVLSSDPGYSFWLRWYEGLLNGDSLNSELLYEIASLPAADWAQGPAHIADRIEAIELHSIEIATPLAERVEWVPEIERIRRVCPRN